MKVYFRKINAFSIQKDFSSRILPFILGLMIYLATIAVVAGYVVHFTSTQLKGVLANKITVEIPNSVDLSGVTSPVNEKHVKDISEVICKIPGVSKVDTVSKESIVNSISNWFGDKSAFSDDIPIPYLIDVEFKPSEKVDLNALSHQLSQIIPGIQIHDHASWHENVLSGLLGIRLFTVFVIALICMCVSAIVIFSTYSSFLVHYQNVQVLRLIGASGAYIARQFIAHGISICAKASIIGIMLSAVTVFWLRSFNTVFTSGWVLLLSLAIPLLMVLIILVTIRLTVMWSISNEEI